jgi:hypothetical protein
MSKSKALTIEEQVRKILGRRLHTTFYESRAERTIKTRGGEHVFDLVSSKGSIVGEVKSTKYPPSGKPLGTKVGDLSRDILLLLGVKRAKRRLLVFTNKKLFDYFKETVQAKIANSLAVETILVEV